MRQSLSFAALIATLPLLPGAALAWPEPCKFSAERSVSVASTGITRIEILARAGDLKVRPAASSTIEASGRACASSPEKLERTQIRSSSDGTQARVFVQVPDETGAFNFSYETLDLTVLVPAGIAVDVIDTSGDVDVQSVRLASVTDSSGDVVVRDVTGDLEVNDSSGDLRLTNVDGGLTVTDSSGDISIDTVKSLRIVRDSSGDIRIARVADNVSIENDSSGDIVVDHVGGTVEVIADSTGDRSIHDVQGTVRLPED